KVADPVEIEEIGADQRSHRSADIGKGWCVFARKDEVKDRGGHDRGEDGYGDANPGYRCGHRMHNKGNGRHGQRGLDPELIADDEIERHDGWNDGAADIYCDNGTR